MEYESDSYKNCNWCAQNHPQRFGKDTGRLGNRRTSGDYGIIKIGQITEKIPGDLKRFAVSQTLVQNSQLRQVGKTLIKVVINYNNNNWNNLVYSDDITAQIGSDELANSKIMVPYDLYIILPEFEIKTNHPELD